MISKKKLWEIEAKLYGGPLSIKQNDTIRLKWVEVIDIAKKYGLAKDHCVIVDRRGWEYDI